MDTWTREPREPRFQSSIGGAKHPGLCAPAFAAPVLDILDIIGPIIGPILAVPTLDSLDFSEIRMWQVEMSNLFVALVPEIVHSATRRPVVAGKGEKQPKTHESS